MTPAIHEWARRNGVSHTALSELAQIMGVDKATDIVASTGLTSEAQVQNQRRLMASKRGGRLWRNNKGVLPDARGVPVRFGLMNDSPALGKKLRSPDLVGIHRVLITPEMVGTVIGQWDSEEVKKPGWVYKGTEHERAQLACGELILSLGGRWRFVTDVTGD